MRDSFRLTLLVLALSVGGCASRPPEVGTVQSQGQYDSQIQDGLGDQKYTEAQMLYQRKLNDYQNQIDQLEQKRENLDASLNARAYEAGVAEAPASSSEAGRIQEFQAAARASQSRVAEATSKNAIQQSQIENRRDKDLLEAEGRAAKQISDLEVSSSKDLAQTTERLNQDIDGRKSIDSAARAEESKKLDDQRITLLLANAEAERMAHEKLSGESTVLARLQSDADGRIARQEAKISDFKRQIAQVEAEIVHAKAEDARAIALQESKVSAARSDSERLAGVTQQLKSSTATVSAALSAPSSAFVQAKESELARAKSEADARKNQAIAAVNARLAQEKNDIFSHARMEIASLAANTEMAKANIVAPVVTGRSVYAGVDTVTPTKLATAPTARPIVSVHPVASVKPVSPPPVLTITRFEPKVDATPASIRNEDIGGVVIAGSSAVSPPKPQSGAAPLVISPKSRSVYDVFYTYKDEGSWKKFQQYLQAYGISDFHPSRDSKTGDYFIYCGRYYDEDQAASRLTYLNKTTATHHAQVRLTQVPL